MRTNRTFTALGIIPLDRLFLPALFSRQPTEHILAANETANGNWTYSYDPFNRVVGANRNSGQSVYNYVYYIAGNRWQQNAMSASPRCATIVDSFDRSWLVVREKSPPHAAQR